MRPVNLMEYAESLTVTQGEHAGDRLTVLPWQRTFLQIIAKSGKSWTGTVAEHLDAAAGGG